MSDSLGLKSRTIGTTDPWRHAFVITPSDASELSEVSRGLHIGGAGDLRITTLHDEDVTLTNVQVGILPIIAKKVWATGTTATGIVGGY